MRLRSVIAAMAAAASIFGAVLPAVAEDLAFGPFRLPGDRPDTIVLDGPIAPGDGALFWQRVIERPELTTLVLSGPGGTLADSLVVAELVHGVGLDTRVEPGTLCGGSCALIFLAGAGRSAAGELALRPIDPGADASPADAEAAALLPARLAAYGAPAELLDIIAALPPKGRLLDPAEIGRLGLDREGVDTALRYVPPAAPPAGALPAPAPAPAMPVMPGFAAPDLGRLDETPADAEMAPVGATATGTIEIRSPDGKVIEHRDIAVRWAVGGEPDAPFARVLAEAENPHFAVSIDYFHDAPPGQPYVGATAIVTLRGEGGLPLDASITDLRALAGRVATPLPFASTVDAAEPDRIVLRLDLLAVFTPLADRTLEAADELALAFTLADGRSGRLLLPVGPSGQQAFAEARALAGG